MTAFARLFALFAVCLSVAAGAFAAPAAADKEADLKKIRARIESIREKMDAGEEQRDTLTGQLKRADLDIQSKRQDLAAARAERQAGEKQLTDLRREQADTERRIAAEREQLAAALRVAYVNGRAEQLKLLLNQEDPALLGRMVAYYGYFGRARAARIDAIGDQLAHLGLLTEKIAAETERLKLVEASMAERVANLARSRQQRRKELTALQANLRSRGGELKKLEQQAAGLEKLIAELRRALSEFPALPSQAFQKVQGKLPWPIKGKVLARFGAPYAGGLLKRDGILIGAAPGTQVRAPFHGRVVYADWRNGFGLLVILDHGGGYFSIYGNLEELYRKPGDTVAPGDPLGALAEQGAEDRGELYMEIRKGAEPLDPQRWLTKP